MKIGIRGSAASLVLGAMLWAGTLQAQTIADWLSQSHIDGNVRSYYYTQRYGGTAQNTYAYSLGGKLEVTTKPIYGFNVGVAFYTANDLGVNDVSQPSHIDGLLMGTSHTLNTLGQAYVQYRNRWVQVKVGNQLLDTPWMRAADAFMVPNAFEALDLIARPLPGISIEALRSLRYKYRALPSFSRNSLLNLAPSTELYPGLPGTDNGALAFGLRGDGAAYGAKGAKAQVWYYQFYNYANLFYAATDYTVPTGAWSPFVNAQIAREWNNGAALLGPVNGTIYGLKLGLHTPVGTVHWAYNQMPTRDGYLPAGGKRTLYNGNFVAPYEQQNNIDPLYTTIMNYGLVGASAPGHAWQLGLSTKLGHRIKAEYAFTRFDTAPYVSNVTANTIDVAYTPGGFFKGLSLRNRLGVDHGFHTVTNAPTGTFVDERVMIQYSFSN